MKSRAAVVFPKDLKVLKALGDNIDMAMKRRKLSQTQLSERTGISKPTLRNIVRGESSVSIGHYLIVLSCVGLSEDLTKVALDHELGLKLQDIERLKKRKPPQRNKPLKQEKLSPRLLVNSSSIKNGDRS